MGFKRDLVNKSLSLEKIFKCWTRWDLEGCIPKCSSDEVMTKIREWLNK